VLSVKMMRFVHVSVLRNFFTHHAPNASRLTFVPYGYAPVIIDHLYLTSTIVSVSLIVMHTFVRPLCVKMALICKNGVKVRVRVRVRVRIRVSVSSLYRQGQIFTDKGQLQTVVELQHNL